MAETIRIGLIGAGANTRLRHIPGFQAIEGVELVAVCNRSLESGQAVADEFGIARVTVAAADPFADESTDARPIGTGPSVRRQLTAPPRDAARHARTLCGGAAPAANAAPTGVRRTAMTSGAAGTCFAKSPHFANSALRASSRKTMKCHGCVFFELPAIRPACRMRCNVSSEIGSSLYSRLSRFVRMQVLASM